MKKTTILFLIAGLTYLNAGKAQQTGSFSDQLTFMGQSRTLSCYVPTNYNASNKYRLMICLHGLGDNSTNYRNALISQLNWQTNFPNTIFICPDGGPDANKDFYTPAGDEGIIDESILYAMQNYHIDSNFVVLQGFSLGGRSAIKFGLDNPSDFKGLLLNTPAFQGKKDADNDPLASLNYNYGNASQIPIYITVGDQDLYYFIIDPLIKKLKKQDAVLNYIPVAGIGHTVPGSSYTSPSFPFFEDPTQVPFDVDLFDIEMPQHTCNASIAPDCFIQNKGDSLVTSVDINYQFAGNMGTYTWTGSLGPYQSARVNLPSLNTSQGSQVLELGISNLNGNKQDTVTPNNDLGDTTEVDVQSEALQVSEGFEGKSPGWVFTESGTLFEWYRDTDVKKTGTASIANFNTILLFYTRGNVESFESPVIDLSTVANSKLSFDVAYNYHKYTPPVVTRDTSFTDTLQVTISTDCGQTWQTLYKKAGAALATASTPIINPLNLNQVFFNPTASQWRTDTVDLGAFANETEVILRFNYISDNGGSIYIDNILIDGRGLSQTELQPRAFEIYPNPAKERFTAELAEGPITAINVYDMSGNKVLGRKSDNRQQGSMTVDIGQLSTGVYQVEVVSKGTSTYSKLLISK